MTVRDVWLGIGLCVLLAGVAVGQGSGDSPVAMERAESARQGETAGWVTHIYGRHGLAAKADGVQVPESSGVVAGRRSPDIYWTHNDAGAKHPRVWAFRLSEEDQRAGVARILGYVELPGASNVDWEDIAAGPDGMIYVLDGGDNSPCRRFDKRIHRFAEPVVESQGSPLAMRVPFDSLRFEYPDAEHPDRPAGSPDDLFDAECLLVHPISGDVYVVTKRNTRGTPATRVFKLAADDLAWDTERVHVLRLVADLSSPRLNMVTGGEVDPHGRRVVLRNYLGAFEYLLPADRPFDEVFRQSARFLNMGVELAGQLQGEAICYTRDGGDLITTTEARRDGRFSVFRTNWQLANLRVEDIGADRATVRWNTASPTGSRVEFGPTPACGEFVDGQGVTASHAVTLTGLAAGTEYYYRVTSGSLRHPLLPPLPSFRTAGPSATTRPE